MSTRIAFVNPEVIRFAPRSVVSCRESKLEYNAISGYIHYLSYGASESNCEFVMYYPENPASYSKIEIIITTKAGKEIGRMKWVHGDYGLCKAVFNKFSV